MKKLVSLQVLTMLSALTSFAGYEGHTYCQYYAICSERNVQTGRKIVIEVEGDGAFDRWVMAQLACNEYESGYAEDVRARCYNTAEQGGD